MKAQFKNPLLRRLSVLTNASPGEDDICHHSLKIRCFENGPAGF